MPPPLTPKFHKVCENIDDLNLGQHYLVFDNLEGAQDCLITNCGHALEKAWYVVPAGHAVRAELRQQSAGTYKGSCCPPVHADPTLIVH
jgi:hypothetical protein